MYLLRTITKHSETFALVEDYDHAKILAQTFVGEHYPADSCSTERQEFERASEGLFRVWRSTSFGQRRAEVQTIETIG